MILQTMAAGHMTIPQLGLQIPVYIGTNPSFEASRPANRDGGSSPVLLVCKIGFHCRRNKT